MLDDCAAHLDTIGCVCLLSPASYSSKYVAWAGARYQGPSMWRSLLWIAAVAFGCVSVKILMYYILSSMT